MTGTKIDWGDQKDWDDRVRAIARELQDRYGSHWPADRSAPHCMENVGKLGDDGRNLWCDMLPGHAEDLGHHDPTTNKFWGGRSHPNPQLGESTVVWIGDVPRVATGQPDMTKVDGPHSRACGVVWHEHGQACHRNCPTCHGGRPTQDVGLLDGPLSVSQGEPAARPEPKVDGKLLIETRQRWADWHANAGITDERTHPTSTEEVLFADIKFWTIRDGCLIIEQSHQRRLIPMTEILELTVVKNSSSGPRGKARP